jgi:Icc protein
MGRYDGADGVTMADTMRVVQLSDTHFLEEGAEPEGGGSYDTGAAFEAVFEHMGGAAGTDLVVVTGDIADHGRAKQYRKAAAAFSRLDAPVNVCPGNHDQDAAFSAGMGRATVGTSRVVELGNWCFLFADSNAGIMIEDSSGRHVDPPGVGDRLHTNGALGEREIAWVRDMCGTTLADHVFIWIHHPPSSPLGMVRNESYGAEWAALLGDLAIIRGFGVGHTHVPATYEVEGRPVFVAPALKNNFDIDAQTWLPPGYRTYEFGSDGTVKSDVQLVEDQRWPRKSFGRALLSLFNGEITHAQLDEIVARRQRAE